MNTTVRINQPTSPAMAPALHLYGSNLSHDREEYVKEYVVTIDEEPQSIESVSPTKQFYSFMYALGALSCTGILFLICRHIIVFVKRIGTLSLQRPDSETDLDFLIPTYADPPYSKTHC